MTEQLNNSNACDPRKLPRLNFSICEMRVKVCMGAGRCVSPAEKHFQKRYPRRWPVCSDSEAAGQQLDISLVRMMLRNAGGS